MTTEHVYAVEQRTRELPPVGVTGTEPDPLARITLPPRGFGATLAAVALVLGLILAIIPVHVAGNDPAAPNSVVCGNTIGGVEIGTMSGGLHDADRASVATYVNTCETAIAERRFSSQPAIFLRRLRPLRRLLGPSAPPPPRRVHPRRSTPTA